MSFSISISKFESGGALHYVWSFFIVFLGILGVVGGTNLVVDPSQLFGLTLRHERSLAALLLQGKNVVVENNLNIHAVRKFVVAGQTVTPEAVIFGSSRTWDVAQDMFPNWRFFNAGTNSATIDDYVSLWGLFESARAKPKLVVFGADPWIFNRANPPLSHCMKLSREFTRAAQALGGVSVDRCLAIPPYRELLSWDRLMISLRFLRFKYDSKGCGICAVAGAHEEMPVLGDLWHADGSLNHFRPLPAAEVAMKAQEQGKTSPRFKFFDGMAAIDPQLVDDWRKLLRRVQVGGSKVVIYLSPFHPAYIDGIAGHKPEDIKLLAKVEEAIRRIALEFGASVVGSYSPKAAGCGQDEYFDAIHIMPTCIARILSSSDIVIGGPSSQSSFAADRPN